MAEISAEIKIDGEPATDIFLSLLEMEIEEDHRMASVFRIRIAITRNSDGLWNFLDDERLTLWRPVIISAIIGDQKEELIDGYITQIKSRIAAEEADSFVEIWGMDPTCVMGLEEKIKDWPGKKDSAIAEEIFGQYDLDTEVEDTGVVHEEEVATIIQRETDIQFLRRLARRNGYECFVKGGTGYFRRAVLTEEPQPALAAHFGAETNLNYFEGRINGQRPVKVEMLQIDTIAKEVQDVSIESGTQRTLGRDAAELVTVPEGAVSKVYVKNAVALDNMEMQNLCQAVFDEAEWFIEARGEVESSSYQSILKAKSLVPVKGVGELFSGLYYVTSVKHVFRLNKYVQEFSARRNASAPGPDDFGGASLLGGLL